MDGRPRCSEPPVRRPRSCPTGGMSSRTARGSSTGKHNYVLRSNCDAIARKLGNADLHTGHQARARKEPSSLRPVT